MKIRVTSLAAGLVLGGSLLLAATGAVSAVSPPPAPAGKGACATQATAARTGATVDTLKAFGDCEISRRITTLDALSARVTASKVLTSAHASALQSEIGSTKSGLTSLKATLDAETTVEALKADITKIVTDYRVYVLLVPQVNLVNGADGVMAAQAKFADINTKLTAAIAAAKAKGKDTTAAQASLDAMNAAVAKAVGLASPLPEALLPLTPAQYNAGTAGPIIGNARTALGQARDQLKAAMAAAKACRDALKALK
jgi:hypothetical protein